MVTRRAVMLAVGGALALVLATARARGDEPRDFDADAEERSSFWERGVQPGREAYEDLITRGAELVASDGDKESRARAAAIFRDAMRMAPDRALAHFWLGRVAAKDGDFKGCARAMEQALALEAAFIAPSASEVPTNQTAPYELGLCQARAGEYEAAIDTFRRIIGQAAEAPPRLATVHMRLGESYMALGRLDEAIEALSQATRLDARNNLAWLALAIAHDRDEDGASSREAMAKVLENDSRVDHVIDSRATWIPAHDASYYLGLAYLHAGDAARSLFHLRRYLAVAGESLWSARARTHFEVAQAGAVAGHDLKLTGSATLDPAKTAAAVARGDAAFQSCLATTPDILLKVSITRVVAAPPKKRARARPSPGSGELIFIDRPRQPGVRVLIKEQAPTKSDLLRAAMTCAESAASTLALPRPEGPEGTYAIADFSITRR